VWGGSFWWLLIGHQFMVGKRGKVIGGSIHSNDTVGAGIIRSIIGGGCYDVKELVLASKGMWSTVIVG